MPLNTKIPLFEQHTLEEIEENTGWSLDTLILYARGYRKMSRKFRLACCAVFESTELQLFGAGEDGEVTRGEEQRGDAASC